MTQHITKLYGFHTEKVIAK